MHREEDEDEVDDDDEDDDSIDSDRPQFEATRVKFVEAESFESVNPLIVGGLKHPTKS